MKVRYALAAMLLAYALAAGTAAALTPPVAVGSDTEQGDEAEREALLLSPLRVTHGVAAGGVRSDSAVIWSRTDRNAVMHVEVRPGAGDSAKHGHMRVRAADDYTGKITIKGLRPDTEYRYKVWFNESGQGGLGRRAADTGRFHTAPAAEAARVVRFAWGGDVAGQNVCRDAKEGFPIFKAINALRPDFFIGLGDMIYADGTCEAVGRYGNPQVPGDFRPAANMADYWRHWKYNRADTGFRQLLANMPYYAIWDDHEVVNDFGPLHDTRDYPPYTPGMHLLPMGLRAFLNYNPVAQDAATPKRLYRTVRWGKRLELFILDTRQYRDANGAPDSAQRPKTLLGREQLTWLKQRLKDSDATWKVIVSSVPMSIPTGGNGRDGWANYDTDQGFEHELLDILRSMQKNGVRNVVWITTDVHFGEVFRYTPFADDPSFQVYEFVTGPLNAGLFPKRTYDTTLGTESLFFYGPDSSGAVTRFDEARKWMNFGTIGIDESGRLEAAILDIDGHPVYRQTLLPR